ncbi:carbohydrate ABC transporter permease [Paenibacillus macquariensis]|uniref:Carbohydrate ABC transporter membrane protein 2, CUT1 family n=1 Tax=Paenibacillus macquariensis TaxID=948756 RepID=A0ABY1K1N6_9BACL|nr:carbohydrate ABC transporter permease [Paenibacillus macquariensis]MEC0091732.1 carbohydrate ABC transporter permease [Paenibacillus macquariensis]OAB32342.1 sugar ABC transporter ATP-binding protein [Paenibacillus macquariensis subsp. macquariensis]SIR13087.1 carbohydrate ABC transporter membrane protein 2, CUT1 family [Paenibacillus macquariensis]
MSTIPSTGPHSPSSKVRRRRKFDAVRVMSFISLVIITFLMLLPLFFMVSTSLKSKREMLKFPPTFLPETWQWSNYKDIFDTLQFGTLYGNSLLIGGLTVVGTLISSSLAAYGFARYRGKGKNIWFMLLLSTMMLPYPAIMIPQFILFSKMNWIDTFLPLIVPAFFGSAYNIFLLRQFFTTLPDELFDAGRIDGCGEFRMWLKIALPLSGPALATVAIFAFIYSWNDLLTPVLYLSSSEKFTLPVGMASLTSSRFRIPPWHLLMVASVLAMVPIVTLFAIAQKRFVEGIVLTGIK